jgi:cytochrome c2
VSVAGKLGRESVADQLIAMLDDEAAEVRSAAAKELGQIGASRALMPLIEALSDQDPQVRLYAAWSLRELDDPRVPPLLERLQDPDLGVRIIVAETLASIARSPASADLDLDIVEHMVDVLSPDELVRGGEFVIFGPEGRARRGVGRGQCPLCHTFGAGESAERAPNLFGSTDLAGQRVKELRYQQADFVQKESFPGSGRATTAIEYLAESKVCPSCYVVEGFGVKGSLDRESPDPAFHKPPMNLAISDMIMVDAWLFANDGKQPPPAAAMRMAYERFIPEAERVPGRQVASARAAPHIYTGDDDPREMIVGTGCAACHKIPRVGANVGAIGPLLVLKEEAAKRIASSEYQQQVKAGRAHATIWIGSPPTLSVNSSFLYFLFGIEPMTALAASRMGARER